MIAILFIVLGFIGLPLAFVTGFVLGGGMR